MNRNRTIGMLTAAMLSLVLGSCGDGRPAAKMAQRMSSMGLVQEKKVHDVHIQLSYIPRCPEKAAAGLAGVAGEKELAFRLQVMPGREKEPANMALSYGLDTLFALVVQQDTLSPVLAQRVANGNVGGITYLVVFEREAAAHAGSCKLVFQDRLFTNMLLSFPIDVKNANNLDAISCNL